MRRPLCSLIVVIAGLACIPSASGQVFTDSLNGSTTGTRSGGTFTGGGWRVDNQYDSIYWHTGTYAHGAFEYNAIGSSTPESGHELLDGSFEQTYPASSMKAFTHHRPPSLTTSPMYYRPDA